MNGKKHASLSSSPAYESAELSGQWAVQGSSGRVAEKASQRECLVGDLDLHLDLIRKAKATAAMQGVTLREWVLKCIEEKLKKVSK
jgi:hypothetical protein